MWMSRPAGERRGAKVMSEVILLLRRCGKGIEKMTLGTISGLWKVKCMHVWRTRREKDPISMKMFLII